MKLKSVLDVIVAVAAVWGAVLSSSLVYKEYVDDKPEIYVSLRAEGKVNDTAQFLVSVKNVGGAATVYPQAKLLIFNEKHATSREINVNLISNRAENRFPQPNLIEADEELLFTTSKYPRTDVLSGFNAYLIRIEVGGSIYTAYFSPPQSAAAVQALLDRPASEMNFDNITIGAQRALILE